jgi:hypothetical protein
MVLAGYVLAREIDVRNSGFRSDLSKNTSWKAWRDSPEWVSIKKQIPISVQIISRVSKKKNKKKNIIFLQAPISNYRIDNRSRPCEIGE